VHADGTGTRLARQQILDALEGWNRAWNEHDLDAIMELFHEDVLFENWTGARVKGKEALRAAWDPWFAADSTFRFTDEDIFVDEEAQKALYRWQLDWPSLEPGQSGKVETRRGVDVLTFRDGLVAEKLTYSKTTLELDGERVPLSP
jgi:ketosteroid isomerase-like protein